MNKEVGLIFIGGTISTIIVKYLFKKKHLEQEENMKRLVEQSIEDIFPKRDEPLFKINTNNDIVEDFKKSCEQNRSKGLD